MNTIRLGNTYRDQVTGFTGIATNHGVYSSGCNRVTLTGKVNKAGEHKTYCCDETTLKLVSVSKVFPHIPLTHAVDRFGQPSIDIISGFKGIVVGSVISLSGSAMMLLAPPVTDKEGKRIESEWFDIQRVKADKGKVISLTNGDTPGADADPVAFCRK